MSIDSDISVWPPLLCETVIYENLKIKQSFRKSGQSTTVYTRYTNIIKTYNF